MGPLLLYSQQHYIGTIDCFQWLNATAVTPCIYSYCAFIDRPVYLPHRTPQILTKLSINFTYFLESKKYSLSAICFFWMLMHIFCYYHFGILSPIDTSYYLENANAILTESTIDNRAWWYISYISLLALSIELEIFPSLIVLTQLMASLLSVLAIQQLTNKLNGNKISGLISGMLMIIWFKFSQWDYILYTDSLFTSLVILSIYTLNSSKKAFRFISAILILITVLIRPTGIGFLLVLILTWYYIRFYPDRYKRYLILPAILIAAIIINFVLIDFIPSFIESYAKGLIIYPYITFDLGQDQLHIPENSNWPLIQLIEFICYNPVYIIKAFFIKAGIYLIHAKSYYSIPHNFFIGIILCPTYSLAILSAIRLPKSTIKTFAMSFIVIQMIIVGLTSENWDGRFLFPILPWVFLLAGASLPKLNLLKSRSPLG